jgi:hypothetical protein
MLVARLDQGKEIHDVNLGPLDDDRNYITGRPRSVDIVIKRFMALVYEVL